MSDTFERDLRAWLAYGDELTRHTTVADRVVRNVETRTLERPVRGTGRARLLLLAAAVAAVLLTAIGLPHVLLRSQPGGSYPASPPSNVPNRRPPAGIALVWVKDPAKDDRIIALDHPGHPVGWLPEQAELQTGRVNQSGDGQRLLLDDFDLGGVKELTAQGRRIALPAEALGAGPGTWSPRNIFFSDDNRSLCLEDGPRGTPRDLVVIDADGHVARRVPETPAGNPSYLSWHVVTCSVRNDVAVLIGQPDEHPQPTPTPSPTPRPTPTQQSHGMNAASASGSMGVPVPVNVPTGAPNYIVRVVRLSTGAEIARRVDAPEWPIPTDASDDGTLVLEAQRGGLVELRNIATGALVGQLTASVQGLLGNHLAIVQGYQPNPNDPVPHSVADMTTGATLWQAALSLGSVVSYLGDGATVLTVTPGINPGACPTWATVQIADLLTGTTTTTRLDTCPH